jgi:hypothetical protein
MNCQQSGSDAEIDAETWDPVHLRFAARPGMSLLAVMPNKHSLDLVNDRNPLSVSMLRRRIGMDRYSTPQWLLSA